MDSASESSRVIDWDQPEALTAILRVAMRLSGAEGAFLAVMTPSQPRLAAQLGLDPEQHPALLQLAQGQPVLDALDLPWRSAMIVTLPE